MSMLRLTGKVVAWSAVGVLGLGAAAGAAETVGSHQATGPAATSPSAKSAHQHKHRAMAGKLRGLGRVEHGEVTARGKDAKTETLDLQRGQLTRVSAGSITVRSLDGFTHSYAVTSATKVHLAKGETGKTVTDVKPGTNVTVVAVKSGSTDTARFVGVQRQHTGHQAGKTRSSSAPSTTG